VNLVTEQNLVDFVRSLANVTNNVSSYADMEGSVDCLAEDSMLMGLSWMSPIFRSLDVVTVKAVMAEEKISDSDVIVGRMSRIASLLRKLSETQVSASCNHMTVFYSH
jgi:hypothetical protein